MREEIIAEFPDLTLEQMAACLDYARDLAEFMVTALMALRFFADHCAYNLGKLAYFRAVYLTPLISLKSASWVQTKAP